MTRLWIKSPMAILADGAENGVVVEEGRIVEKVARGASPTIPVEDTFDAGDHVVLPGLINTHHHFYQTLTRAFPPALNQELFPWLTTLYPVWARLGPDDLALATRVALAELMLSGCTTTTDHHYLFPPGLEDAIDIEILEARKLGMRCMMTRGSMNLSKKDGGPPPDGVVQDHDTILADSERLIDAHHEREAGAMVQIALAPCSPFSVTKDLMVETAELAERMDVPLHTHLAETEDEERFCLKLFGHRPIDYLEDVGWLSSRVWLAHGIHFPVDDLTRLAKAGTGISHCASSNLILSSGHCPVREAEELGCAVGLAVDGSASSDCSNMMQEVRTAFLLQRHHYGMRVTHHDALRWATEGSARLIGRDDIGRVDVGKRADLALFKLDELRFSGSGDPIASLVNCGAHRADRVMIEGMWTVVDGRIPGLNLHELRSKHQTAADRLQKFEADFSH